MMLTDKVLKRGKMKKIFYDAWLYYASWGVKNYSVEDFKKDVKLREE